MPLLDFEIELKGITLPAARTEAVLIKSLRVELMMNLLIFACKVMY